jgi:hypothetical protein
VPGRRFSIPEGSQRLLAYVALNEGRVSRSRAAGTVRPYRADDRAAGSLRSALWRLKGAGPAHAAHARVVTWSIAGLTGPWTPPTGRVDALLTVGVDLAAEPRTTAVAWLEWSADRAVLTRLEVGCGDDLILEAVAEADRAGIDCPFGWPDAFVDFVTDHRAAALPPRGVDRSHRRDLTLRLTDRIVHARTGLTPLSVSADRIAHPAMRCAGLLAQLAENGHPVDRSGAGKVAEVYPAASLRCWRLDPRGYKRAANVEKLGALVTELRRHTDPWLDLGPFEHLCRHVDDAADALVAALTVRAALTAPDASQRTAAASEGWIGLPETPLADLLEATSR